VPETPEEEALLDRGDLDLSVAAVHRIYVDGYRLGVSWWLAHPADAAALLARKVRLTLGALALGYGPHDWPAGLDGIRRRVDLFEPDRLWLVPVHLGLLVAGWLWLRRRQPQVATLVAIPVVTLLASTVLFYGYVRLGVAYLPVLWPLQAMALAALAHRVGALSRLATRPLALATAGVVLGVAAMAAMTMSPRTPRLDGVRNDAGQLLVDEAVRVSDSR